MLEQKSEKREVVPSFESLSLEEMHALEGDTDIIAEASPTTTSSPWCVAAGGGLGTMISAAIC